MTSKQFLSALDRLGLTQAAFARLVGVTPRHANRWAKGEWDVPRPVAIVLELLAAGKIKVEDLG